MYAMREEGGGLKGARRLRIAVPIFLIGKLIDCMNNKYVLFSFAHSSANSQRPGQGLEVCVDDFPRGRFPSPWHRI
jgi:hypothetical protein